MDDFNFMETRVRSEIVLIQPPLWVSIRGVGEGEVVVDELMSSALVPESQLVDPRGSLNTPTALAPGVFFETKN